MTVEAAFLSCSCKSLYATSHFLSRKARYINKQSVGDVASTGSKRIIDISQPRGSLCAHVVAERLSQTRCSGHIACHLRANDPFGQINSIIFYLIDVIVR